MTSERSENERQYDIIDQLLTMHSVLKQRFTRRSRLVDACLTIISLLLAALALATREIAEVVSITPDVSSLLIGLASVLVVGISVIQISVDWKAIASSHQRAVRELGGLKAEYRESFEVHHGEDAKENARLSTMYDTVVNRLVGIPERDFALLKSRHIYKKLLSRKISENPGVPVFVLRLSILASGIVALSKTKGRGE